MLTVEEWMDVQALSRAGHSVRAIARLTGYSRNTVKKLLTQPAPQPFRQPPRASKLDPFRDYLTARYQQCPLSAVRLLAEIRPMGYDGSIDLVRRFLAPFQQRRRGQAKATVRFETPPGQQGQVDWQYLGTFPDALGQPVKIYGFVMVLGFSRMLYVEFTTSMALPELLRCHQNAFAFFGGWPQELLYDNMAQVRQSRSPSSPWNPLFLDFAQHYGFLPRTCRVRRPRTKGKVERGIGYLEDNFLAGRAFADLPDLNAQTYHWLTHTANVRLHATTGRRPLDLLAAEGLTPVAAARPYQLCQRAVSKASPEGRVHVDGSTYSVPPEHVGQTLLIETGEHRVTIRCGEVVVAQHPRAQRRGECVVDPEHVAAMWRRTVGSDPPPDPEGPFPPPRWQVTFQEGVATTPLAVYEQCAPPAPAPGAGGPS